MGIQTLHNFEQDPVGGTPYAGPAQGPDGAFYGTTATGGDFDLGAIYRMTASGNVATLLSFNATNGAEPRARLLPGPNGTFYGTTRMGGTNDLGTVFRVTTNGTFDTLCHFNGTIGAHPFATLVEGSNGELYGTAERGGIGFSNSPQTGFGTVFRLNTNGSVTSLHYFNGTNGSYPRGLIRTTNGTLYGVATEGGATFDGGIYSGYGGVFRINTNGTFELLGSFTGPTGDVPGKAPMSLAQGTNGILYGTTWGGPYIGSLGLGTGTLFKYDPTSGILASIFTFLHTNGSLPVSLDLGNDGKLYGMTYNPAVLFSLGPDETVTTLAHFPSSTQGASDLVRGTDGQFYGATLFPASVFRAVQLPVIQSLSISNDGSRVLEWSSFTNGRYRVERTPSLPETNWTALTPDVIASGTSAAFTDLELSENKGFYRVVLLPP